MDSYAQTQPVSDDDIASDAIRDAEAAVAALAECFLEWITEDIGRARQALEAAQASPGDNRQQLRDVFEVMHNVKGQGGSFGYDLLTKIGGSLCNYLRDEASSADDKQLRVIAARLAAIDFVLEKNLMGDGGKIGGQLTAKVTQLVENIPASA